MSTTRPVKDFRHIAASVVVILAFVALMVLVVSSRDAAPNPRKIPLPKARSAITASTPLRMAS